MRHQATPPLRPLGVAVEHTSEHSCTARDGVSASSVGPRALWTLSLGNFVIGTGTMIIAGLLNVLATDLGASIATIGQLITGYGLAVCIGAPVLASLTGRVCRRRLLVLALTLFSLGHLLAAAAPSYALLMFLRVCTGFGAAIFTPQAAAMAGQLVPAAQRGRAIAIVFLGFSVASVLGNPAGIVLGASLGWRVSFVTIGVASAIAAVMVRAWVPARAPADPLDRSAWRRALGNPTLLLVLATTILSAAGQFVVVAYLAPLLHAYLSAESTTIGLLFGWFGVCGLVGNYVGGGLVDRLGSARVVNLSVTLMLLGLLLWPLTYGSLPYTLLALAVWGLGCFATNSAQQARLVVLSPRLAPASVALNSSGFYLGQASGAAIGGIVMAAFGMAALSWAGSLLLLLGLGTSWLAERVGRVTEPNTLSRAQALG